MGAVCLLATPGQQQALIDDPGRIATAVEEILRAPGRSGGGVPRYARTDLSFGHGHYCLGAPLARIELQAVSSQLRARFPAMRLAVPVGQLRMRSGSVTGGLTTLPAAWQRPGTKRPCAAGAVTRSWWRRRPAPADAR